MRLSVTRVLVLGLVLLFGGVSESSTRVLSQCPDCRNEQQATPDATGPCAFCVCCASRVPAASVNVGSVLPPTTFVLVDYDSVEAVAANVACDIFHPPRG
jgi:hypothetical protein